MWRDFTDPRLTWESLIRQAAGILGLFILVAFLWQTLGAGFPIEKQALQVLRDDGVGAAEQHIMEYLRDHRDDSEAWLLLVRNRVGTMSSPTMDDARFLATRKFAEQEHDSPIIPTQEMREFTDSARGIDPELLQAFLEYETAGVDAAIAVLEGREDSQSAALRWELAVGGNALTRAREYAIQWFDLDPCRRSADAVVTTLGWESAVDEPEVVALASPSLLMTMELLRDNVASATYYGILSQLEFDWRDLIAALIIGILWTCFLLNFGVATEWPWSVRIGIGVAFLLGIASLTAALAIIIPMNHALELGATGYLASAIYSLAIGVREEFVKFLLFLPMVPFIRKWTSVQILVAASVVGLGFAVGENIDYYDDYQGRSVFSRFVTANFLHLTLTGLVGHSFVRAIQRKLHWDDFLSQFGFAALAHAAYDYVLIEPQLAEYGLVSVIIFVFIAQRYLRLLQSLRPERRLPIPPTRLFLTCLATSTGFHYLLVAANHGYFRGIPYTGSDVVASGLLLIMYFREFKERIE